MKRSILSLLLTLVAGCASHEATPRPASTKPIFREVTFGGDKKIVLGAPFSAFDMSDSIGPRLHSLRPGTFGGAERMTVRTTKANLVEAILAEYAPGTAYTNSVRSYVQTLGQPQYEKVAADSTVARWEDALTIFELKQIGTGPNARLQSALYDRQLSRQ